MMDEHQEVRKAIRISRRGKRNGPEDAFMAFREWYPAGIILAALWPWEQESWCGFGLMCVVAAVASFFGAEVVFYGESNRTKARWKWGRLFFATALVQSYWPFGPDENADYAELASSAEMSTRANEIFVEVMTPWRLLLVIGAGILVAFVVASWMRRKARYGNGRRTTEWWSNMLGLAWRVIGMPIAGLGVAEFFRAPYVSCLAGAVLVVWAFCLLSESEKNMRVVRRGIGKFAFQFERVKAADHARNAWVTMGIGIALIAGGSLCFILR